MAKKPQTVYYPSTATPGQSAYTKPFCTACNTDQSRSCCTSTSSCNQSTNAHACSAVCDSCQNACNTVQNYCGTSINRQLITDHGNIDSYPTYCEEKDEFIFRNWTAIRWNRIVDNLRTAFDLGWTLSHNEVYNEPSMTDAVPDPTNVPHPANSLVTAKKYNEVAKALNAFLGTNIQEVKGAAEVGCEAADVIRAAHAKAQHTNYDKAKFSNSVCDICNTKAQFTSCPCDCDCSCACDCSCGCSCPCNCNCSCTCTCSCSSQ